MGRRKIDHLLIGGGIASATAAQALRAEGAHGSIAIVGRELGLPYHRPPVSKEYLRGEQTSDSTLIHRPDWYGTHEVEALTRTSVLDLDLQVRVARFSSKEEVEFGQVLIATGAMVRRLTVEGSGLEGIHYLRALGNADAIRRDTESAEHVVIVGGSYIACEVAASLTTLGRHCTMVMLEGYPLERGFGTTIGRYFHELLEQHGVRVIGDDEVERFEGRDQRPDARVARVVTRGGHELSADAVIAGVGVTPDVTLGRRAGLEIGELGGLRVDSRLRASAEGVFAAGDIAEYDSVLHDRALRIEHEDVAAEQGRTVARNMLGQDRAHTAVPYFFSDLADWASMEYVGPAPDWDEEILRGDLKTGSFTQWYLKHDRVVAALAVGRSPDIDHARRLIAARKPLSDDKQRLADVDQDLAGVSSS